jgi:hypothetical protein
MSTPKGYSSQEKEDRLSAQFSTVEPVRQQQFGLSTVAHQYAYEVATDAVEIGSTDAIINATSHVALKGDIVLFTSGALNGVEVKVWSVSANKIEIAETLTAAPAPGDTFAILRHKYPSVDSTGKVNVNAVIAEAAVAADGGALPALTKVVSGYDGAAVQVLKTDAAGELQIDVLSSALPSGAATSAAQTDGSQKTQIVDGSGNVVGSTGNALDVNVKTPITVDVSLSEANDSVAVYGNDGTNNRALKTDANGELQIDVLSSALPTGAATETTLSAVSGKLPATLGQKTLASGLAVSIASDQSAIPASQSGTWNITNVSGTVSLPTGAATSALQTTGNTSLSNIDGKLTTTVNGLSVDGSAVTQPVSAASLPLPSGAATETTLAAVKTAVETIDNAISGNEMQVDVKTIEGVIDANNTTDIPLGIGGTFIGAWTDLKDYNSINLGVFSDVASATDGLRIEYSYDGITVHHFHLWTFLGGANGVGYQLSTEFRYFRINYTNGAVAQTTFKLMSNLKPTALFPSSYRANQTFTAQSQVILTKGIIVGETTGGGGSYVSVKVNPSGALTVESSLSSIDAAVLGQETMANSVPIVIASDQSAIPAAQSGTWNINNISGTVSLPTGAATSANQTTTNTSLSTLTSATLVDNAAFTDGTTRLSMSGFIYDDVAGTALTENNAAAARIDSKRAMVHVVEDGTTRGRYAQVTAANAVKVDGSAVTQPVSAAALPLPTGAATETTLSALNTKVPANLTVTSTRLLVDGSGVTQPVSAASLPLPTGAATETTLSGMSDKLPATLGQKTSANSMAVVLASDQPSIPVSQAQIGPVDFARLDYTVTSVTTGAYVTLSASLAAAVKEIHIFDSSGQTLLFAVGAPGSEVDRFYIFPGGNDRFPISIAAGARVSIKAVSATANSGEISVNFLG